jgi:hypothetical protein
MAHSERTVVKDRQIALGELVKAIRKWISRNQSFLNSSSRTSSSHNRAHVSTARHDS